MITLFLCAAFLLFYSFFGYPLTLFFISAVLGKRKKTYPSKELPNVMLVFPCSWEGKRIQMKINNCQKLDYPKDKLKIVAAPDGATPETMKLLKRAERKGILRVLENCPRSGKMATLARAHKQCKSEVFVNTDADTILEPHHLKELVAPFADDHIGLTAGRLLYGNVEQSGISQSEGFYWKLEILTRRLESLMGRLISATGPIYAIRPELFKPDDPKAPDDMLAPLQALERGKLSLMLDEVSARDYIPVSSKALFARRVRQITSGLDLLIHNPRYLNPFRFPLLAWQLLSHKVLRWMLPFLLILIFISNGFLVANGLIWQIIFGAQIVFYLIGIVGGVCTKRNLKLPVLSSIWHLLLSAWASLVSFANIVRGKHFAVWGETAQK